MSHHVTLVSHNIFGVSPLHQGNRDPGQDSCGCQQHAQLHLHNTPPVQVPLLIVCKEGLPIEGFCVAPSIPRLLR